MNKTLILDVLNQWADGINAAQFDDVVAMYADGASLLPTFHDHACHSGTDIQNYFSGVSKNERVTVTFDLKTLQIDALGSDHHLVTGLYDWVIVNDGIRQDVHARFSFVIIPSDNAPIWHQHSSVVPAKN